MNTRKKTIIAAVTAAVFLCVAGCTAKAEQWRAQREAMQNSVVLINTFEVPQGKEAETLAAWQKSRDFLKTQPGYIGTRLHQNIDPNGKYHFAMLPVGAVRKNLKPLPPKCAKPCRTTCRKA